MENLVSVALPVALAVIMFSLGIGLTIRDFLRVAERGWAFCIGALGQVVLVPLAAYIVVMAFGLPAEIAVGFMLLSFCPGGVTSNMITKLSRGDVALSVSLTAVISLLSILTVPFLAAWAVVHFLGANAPEVNVTEIAIAMFVITTVPVALGVTIRALAPGFASRLDRPLNIVATILFVVIVLGALADNWDIFVENLATMGPALIALNAGLMLIGLGVAAAAGLTWLERKTISVETGIQNATLGITMANIIANQAEGFSTFALPSAVYGILMYLVALPFVLWYRAK